jgi:hypothetical protein
VDLNPRHPKVLSLSGRGPHKQVHVCGVERECLRPDSAISPNWWKRSESNAHIPKDGPLRKGRARQMPSASETYWR